MSEIMEYESGERNNESQVNLRSDNSGYEENDFITLSDIVSPKATTEAPEFSEDIEDFELDGAVNKFLHENDKNDPTTSCKMLSQNEVNNSSTTNLADDGIENLLVERNCSSLIYGEDIPNVSSTVTIESTCSMRFKSDLKGKQSPVKVKSGRGRGRPRKSNNYSEKQPLNESNIVMISNNKSSPNKLGIETGKTTIEPEKECVVPINEEQEIKDTTKNEQVTPVRKRGRPRKSAKSDNVSTLNISQISSLNNGKNESESSKIPKKKRGRPRLSSKITVMSDDDMPLKPRNTVISLNKLQDLNDFGDDIILSELKKSSDQNISNEKETEKENENKHYDDDLKIDNEFNRPVLVLPVEDELPEIKLLNNNTPTLDIPQEDISKHNSEALNIDNIEPIPENNEATRRPRRKAIRRHYDLGSSDEDPFANAESSESDTGKRRQKNKKYSDDDEYNPQGNYKPISSDSSIPEEDDDIKPSKKKKYTKNSQSNKSPKKIKRTRKSNDSVVSVTCFDNDVEQSLQASVIALKPEDTHNAAFENFIANKILGNDLQIKKVKDKNLVQPIEIPILDLHEAKKTAENSSQTPSVSTKSEYSQTSSAYSIKLRNNIILTDGQSKNACEFLKSVLTSTTELGQLMSEKSDEFINKKINTKNIRDTTKVDYCIKKAFLLLKLAKDNLSTMEENLEKEYMDFLTTNKISSGFETEKTLISQQTKPEAPDGDSDCEIIEDPVVKQNASCRKTLFLNKELSIKIAKKPTTKYIEPKKNKTKVDIKGKHSVWINDSIMVKKVIGDQSFLAQDGRCKKPPDFPITLKSVNDFFRQYLVRTILEPYTSSAWSNLKKNTEIICNYFTTDIDKTIDSKKPTLIHTPPENNTFSYNNSNSLRSISNCDRASSQQVSNSPKSLVCYCVIYLKDYFGIQMVKKASQKRSYLNDKQPSSLITLCVGNSSGCGSTNVVPSNTNCMYNENIPFKAPSLVSLCLKVMDSFITIPKPKDKILKVESLLTLCKTKINELIEQYDNKLPIITNVHPIVSSVLYDASVTNDIDADFDQFDDIFFISMQVPPLSSLCIKKLNICLNAQAALNIKNTCNDNDLSSTPIQSLSQMCLQTIQSVFDNQNKDLNKLKNFILPVKRHKQGTVESLSKLSFALVSKLLNDTSKHINGNLMEGVHIYDVNTITQEAFSRDNISDSDNDDIFNDSVESDTNYGIETGIEDFFQAPVIQGVCSANNFEQFNQINSNENFTHPEFVQIKSEPIEATSELEIPYIKQETLDQENSMVALPSTTFIKEELLNVYEHNRSLFLEKAVNYKLEYLESSNNISNIFSQSVARVRKQYDPDSASGSESENELSLLVPQMSRPLTQASAKGTLMESSSEDDNNILYKINKEKRRKRKPQKKIQNKVASENILEKENSNKIPNLTKKMENAIARSTKTLSQNKGTNSSPILMENLDFAGFSASDQSEILQYQRYVKYVFDKIHTKEMPPVLDKGHEIFGDKFPDSDRNETDKAETEALPTNNIVSDCKQDSEVNKCLEKLETSSLLNSSPAEKIICEPTMPAFSIDENAAINVKKGFIKKRNCNVTYVLKDGWHCYKTNDTDLKLNSSCCISLEKLPEKFVKTYSDYIEMKSHHQNDDAEIERLTNLQSLHRANSIREHRHCNRLNKGRLKVIDKSKKTTAEERNRDNLEELMVSEDEGISDREEIISAPVQSTDNCLAKNSLMDDNNSDKECDPKEYRSLRIKKEFTTSNFGKEKDPKIKENIPNLNLTADKVMKKELEFINKPTEDDVPVTITPKCKTSQKEQSKETRSTRNRRQDKTGDDSSSEEEKMWINTKERLIKNLQRKMKDNNNMDDIKRSKLVEEFIERHDRMYDRGGKKRSGSRRISTKMLQERQKQLRVLTNELLGYDDPSLVIRGKKSTSYSNRRKNIRKVLDKKSLQRSTVIANMEEFERKKRLSMRQSRLREIFGYDDGVNVIVINGELCLEYDFGKMTPLVSVHKSLTKVMKAHQYEGVKFMWDACFESVATMESGHPGGGCVLAHCMGLGKTLQVLALLHTALTHPRVGMKRVLVCCPLSTVLNWVDEITKWLDPVNYKIKVFELSKLKKTYERAYQLEDWYKEGGIFIIGYELFRSLSLLDPMLDDVRPTIIQKIKHALIDPGPDIVICDEGHLLKNDASVLAVSMSRIKTRRRIVLTGTPMQNNLREYYCMANFVKPNLLGTYAEYSNRFENPIMNGQHRDSSEHDIRLMKARTHILHKVLESCLQRQEASVLYPYLPKKNEYTVFIGLTNCQSQIYRQYLNEFCQNGKGKTVIKDFHFLQKVWSHPQVLHNFIMRQKDGKDEHQKTIKEEGLDDELVIDEDSPRTVAEGSWWTQFLKEDTELYSLESSNKFVVLFKILNECTLINDKVLIFSTSLFTMDVLEFFLKKINNWSIGQEYYRLDGSVPPEVRQKWCREFNLASNTKTRAFLISTRAGCLGLNMTAANRVILFDTSWNPAHDIQSIFRVYRFGQKKDCYIYRLVAMGTMEQKMYERSVTKQAVACRVVDEQQIDRHYNMAELNELYGFEQMGSGVAAGVAVGVRDVVLLRVARDTPALHAVHEHDSLLRDSRDDHLPQHEREAAWDQFQREQAHNHAFPGKNNTKRKNSVGTKASKIDALSNNGSNMIVPDIAPFSEEIKTEAVPLMQGTHQSSIQYSVIERNEDKAALISSKGKKRFEPDYDDMPLLGRALTRKNTKSQSGSTTTPPIQIENYDDMSHKIVDILVKHNVQKSQEDILSLARGVANLIANQNVNNMNPEHHENSLIRSIANALITENIQKGSNRLLNERLESTLKTVDSIITPVESKFRKKKLNSSERKSRDSLTVAQSNLSIQAIIKNNAEKMSENEIIDLYLNKPLTRANRKLTQNKITSLSHEQTTVPNSQKAQIEPYPMFQLSSDDEDAVPLVKIQKPTAPVVNQKPRPGPKSRTKKHLMTDTQRENCKKLNTDGELDFLIVSDDDDNDAKAANTTVNTAATPTVSKSEVKEPTCNTPLNPKLLRNQHFVKLVAYSYQKNNPLLDTETALRAAEYSIKKAIDENVYCNKLITSGPLYDIAIEVLGQNTIDVLWEKIPQHTNINDKKSSMNTRKSSQTIESIPKTKPTVNNPSPTVNIPPSKPNILKKTNQSKIPPERSENIVPVSLYKGSSPSVDDPDIECILPDEDVSIILPHAQVATANSFPSSTNKKMERDKPASKKTSTKPEHKKLPRKQTIPNVKEKIVNTICLDSDEDSPNVEQGNSNANKTITINNKDKKTEMFNANRFNANQINDSANMIVPDNTESDFPMFKNVKIANNQFAIINANSGSGINTNTQPQPVMMFSNTSFVSMANSAQPGISVDPQNFQNAQQPVTLLPINTGKYIIVQAPAKQKEINLTIDPVEPVIAQTQSKIEAPSKILNHFLDGPKNKAVSPSSVPSKKKRLTTPTKDITGHVVDLPDNDEPNKNKKVPAIKLKTLLKKKDVQLPKFNYNFNNSSSSMKEDSVANKISEPKDPLDILKDVVHIAADNYIIEHPKITPKTYMTKNPKSSPLENTKTKTSDLTKDKPTKRAIPEQSTTAKVGLSEVDKTKKNKPVKTIDLTSTEQKANRNQKKLQTIDLTSELNSKIAKSKIEGNSKSIIISKNGKLQKSDEDFIKSLPKVTINSSTSQKDDLKAKTKRSYKRKDAEQQFVKIAPKKPKIPMTLKDFTLDDLEDIIELE